MPEDRDALGRESALRERARARPCGEDPTIDSVGRNARCGAIQCLRRHLFAETMRARPRRALGHFYDGTADIYLAVNSSAAAGVVAARAARVATAGPLHHAAALRARRTQVQADQLCR